MKKIASIAAVALLGIIVLPSCKKDYTCVCSYTDPSTGETISAEGSLGKTTKKDAKAACEGWNSKYAGFTGVECKLK